MKRSLRTFARLLSLLLIVSFGVTLYASKKRLRLPDESDLRSELDNPPEQSEVSERAFKLAWKGEDYVVYPVADYSVTGLVVTRNDIGAFTDIYHTSNSVDVVDVCLIWGGNAREEVYRNVEFWSEPFSCWVRPKTQEAASEFANDELSNTHLLAENESIARRLSSIRLGDQIRLHGKLVNYHPAGFSEALRKSSTRRDDQGNGACEVMYVQGVEILERGNPGWNRVFDIAKGILWFALAAKLLSFLTFPYLEYRWG